MDKTNQLIFDYLEKNGASSVQTLSTVLHLTKTAVLYQLKKMMAAGLLTRQNFNPQQPGRPEYLYQLNTSHSQPYLDHLCLALFVSLQATKNTSLKEIIPLIAENLPRPVVAEGPFSSRANKIIEFLNSYQFQARWEIHQKGPIIHFKNCPYARIWPLVPDLCQLDTLWLGHLFSKDLIILQSTFINKSSKTGCIFQIQT
jgi:predicted ArsR family transcriptional regulator